MPAKLTTNEFIKKSRRLHGRKYDYSRVKYDGIYKKVRIKCHAHGWFLQSPQSHLSGRGCKKCGLNKIATSSAQKAKQKKERAAANFSTKARDVHGTFYDYSKVKYRDSGTTVKIICPSHGPFLQTPSSHLSGHGCGICGWEKTRDAKIKDYDEKKIKKMVYHAIDQLGGKFPSHHDCIKNEWWELTRVISTRLGGYRKAREKYGFDEAERPKGYWDNFDHVASYLKGHFPTMLELGQCPTVEMMRDTGENPSFLKKYPLQLICKKLDLALAVGFKTRDGHFARSYYELLLDEYLFSRGIKHEPEVKSFKNYNFLCDQKIDGYWIEIWGMTNSKSYADRRKQKENLYKKHRLKLISLEPIIFQKKFNLVEEQLNEIFSERGFDIRKKRPYTMKAIAKAAHYPWTEGIIRKHLEAFIGEHGQFPTTTTLNELGMNQLASRIHQFGGMNHFRKLLGVRLLRKEDYWNERTVTAELKRLCEKLGRFPKDRDLPSDLRNATRRIHSEYRDLNYYREKLGYPITKKSNGYWNEKTIAKEIKLVVKENKGLFPTNVRLREMNRSDLASAISSNGGFPFWRKKLGM